MGDKSQVSAKVSFATKEKLDRFAESHGLRKSFVVEQALLCFMEARTSLVSGALVPTRLVLENGVFDRIAGLIRNPVAPTQALRRVMRGRRG